MKFYPAIGGCTVFDHALLPELSVAHFHEVFFSPEAFGHSDPLRVLGKPSGRECRTPNRHGTASFLDPAATGRIARAVNDWCAVSGVSRLRELVGAAHR